MLHFATIPLKLVDNSENFSLTSNSKVKLKRNFLTGKRLKLKLTEHFFLRKFLKENWKITQKDTFHLLDNKKFFLKSRQSILNNVISGRVCELKA